MGADVGLAVGDRLVSSDFDGERVHSEGEAVDDRLVTSASTDG
jgi:hypothetical protein